MTHQRRKTTLHHIGLMFLISAMLLLNGCASPTQHVETPSTKTATSAPDPTDTPEPTAAPTKENMPTQTEVPELSINAEDLEGIAVRFVHPWGGRADAVIEEIAQQFSLTNQWKIWVNVEAYGSEPALAASLAADLEGGQIPELISVHPAQLAALGDSVAPMDLLPYFDDPEWGFDAEAAGDISEVFLDPFRVEGSLTALPVAPQMTVLFYNQTWAEELGYDSPPMTGTAFRSQACEAAFANLADEDQDNDGTGGYVRDLDPKVLAGWYAAFGGELPAFEIPRFNTDAGRDAFGFLQDVDEEGCIWVKRQPEPYLYFASRYALMYAGTLEQIPAQTAWMEAAGSQDAWGITAFPGPDGSRVVVDGPGLMITAESPEQQLAAWLFAQHLLSPEAQAQLVQALFTLPVRMSALDDLDDFTETYPQWGQGVDLLNQAQPLPTSAAWELARWILQDGITRLLNSEESEVEEILSEVDAMILEFGDTVP